MAVDKEKLKEYQRKYYQKNKERLNKYKNEYGKAHKNKRDYKKENEILQKKYRRYTLHLERETAQLFSKKLADENITASSWFRTNVKKYLDNG